jgi:hypothetical protein
MDPNEQPVKPKEASQSKFKGCPFFGHVTREEAPAVIKRISSQRVHIGAGDAIGNQMIEAAMNVFDQPGANPENAQADPK